MILILILLGFPSATDQTNALQLGHGILGMPFTAPPTTTTPDLTSIAVSASETLAGDLIPVESDLSMSPNTVSAQMYNHFDNTNNAEADIDNQPSQYLIWPTLPRAESANPSMIDAMTPQVQATTHSQSQPPRHHLSPPPTKSIPQLDGPADLFLKPLAIDVVPKPAETRFVTQTGTPFKVQKPPKRRAFTPTRRVEVNQVRKAGACLRCRMLKKTCTSEGTPCGPCRSITTPRLWGACIRFNFIEDFTIHSSGIYQRLVKQDTDLVKGRVDFQPFLGRFDVNHFSSSSTAISAQGFRGQALRSIVPHPSVDQFQNIRDPQNLYLLDIESKDLEQRIEKYLEICGPRFIEHEKSQLLRATLTTVSNIIKENDDVLLRKIWWLWTATLILTDPELTWQISAHAGGAAVGAHRSILDSSETVYDMNQHKLDPESSAYSCALISFQLLAQVEKRASKLSREVMSEVNSRLVQNQKSNPFHTLLAAFLVLNVLERMCWVFQKWDTEAHLPRWPFSEKDPSSYVREAEYFVSVMQRALEVRHVLPKTIVKADTEVLICIGDNEGSVSQWLADLNINQRYLDDCSKAQFDADNFRSLDGTFYTKTLQAEKPAH